nr:hypothetical protein [Micromonospora sp. DSM 115978]
AVLLGRDRLAAEEDKRLADRERLVAQLAETADVVENPKQLADQAATVPFDPAEPERNQALLATFANSPTLVPNYSASLFALDGSVTANLYPDRPVPTVADLGVAWESAVGGTAAVSNLFELDGTDLIATTAPVGGAAPWAVLVTSSDNAQGQAFADAFGDGLVKLDRVGVAVSA